MPVKKVTTPKSSPRKKSSAKKSSSQKISREERANIKKAVSSLSALLVEQTPVRTDVPTERDEEIPETPPVAPAHTNSTWNKPAKPIIRVTPPSAVEKKKRFLLQVVVATIMIFVGSLWIINIRTKFSDAHFNLGSEEKLWQSAKEDFHTVVQQPKEIQNKLKQTAEDAEKLKAQEEVKHVLEKNIFLLTATSTTPSTAENSTSTLEKTTSTITSTTTTSTTFTTTTIE